VNGNETVPTVISGHAEGLQEGDQLSSPGTRLGPGSDVSQAACEHAEVANSPPQAEVASCHRAMRWCCPGFRARQGNQIVSSVPYGLAAGSRKVGARP